MLLSKAEEKS